MRCLGRQVEEEVTNQWVVPYNRFLHHFDCHINVEICANILRIKYITMYVAKGTDDGVLTLQRSEEVTYIVDEIRQYQHGLYTESSAKLSGDFLSILSLNIFL